MIRNLSALVAGIVFGLGLVISQMVNPAKVIAFLDIAGNWDPSLAFVMGGAVIVTFIGYRLVWSMKKPLLGETFQLPQKREIDAKIAIGAVLFGMGWGLVGLCPGPAIAALTFGGGKAVGFIAAMAIGMLAFELGSKALSRNRG
ncbi:DUF6691 family protein [Henriciella litoralis]|uniref:DUF6691 family protein n=1 Tax=Henriciella litoralis TaxID=568102 RepID=UPI000A069351|nr:DUF6691 family protein [Henriciella litoralis]